MAKSTRVYELARDLNLTNKDLLEKLEEMEIPVGTHMSSLDDETVAKVKANLKGKDTSLIEETRVKPTVIRRRKKVITAEPAVSETPAAEEEAPAEAVEAEQPVEEKAKSAPVETAATAPKKKPPEPAARIVSRPSEEKPAEPEEVKPAKKKPAKKKKALKQKKKRRPRLSSLARPPYLKNLVKT